MSEETTVAELDADLQPIADQLDKLTLLQASKLDPGWPALQHQIGQTYFWMRRYPEADRYYREAVSLGGTYLAHRARLAIAWKGDQAEVRSAFDSPSASTTAPNRRSRDWKSSTASSRCSLRKSGQRVSVIQISA